MTHLCRQTVLALIFSVAAGGVNGVLAQSSDVVSTSSGDVSRAKAAVIVARMLEKNRERLAALERYSSERTYRVEYNGTGGHHLAEIKVHAEYTGPEHKQLTIVSESG